jgi:hypothetical protein
MRGICDTCERLSELFQLSGRTDLNCSECHTTIGTTVQLYQALKEIERAGGDASGVEAQLEHFLNRLLNRFRHTVGKASTSASIQ